MKRAVSVSLGSSERDKKVNVTLNGEEIQFERIGTDGDVPRAQALFKEFDGKVDALSMGGVDMSLRLDDRKYPLYAALKLIKDVKTTPVVDGQGLKNTLERRVFELAKPELGEPRFKTAFMPVAVDRLGMAQAVDEVTDKIIFGDFMVDLHLPIPVYGIKNYRRVLRLMLPLVSRFPMSMLFYGSSNSKYDPRYLKYWAQADLIASDFLFMRKHMPNDLSGRTVITNTTTPENIQALKERGVKTIITTTPRYDGRSFGTNMMEAVLTAYAGKGRVLSYQELNQIINELDLRPTVMHLD